MRNLENHCPRSDCGQRAYSISLLTQLVPIVEHKPLLSQNDAPLFILKNSRFLLPVQVLVPLGSGQTVPRHWILVASESPHCLDTEHFVCLTCCLSH